MYINRGRMVLSIKCLTCGFEHESAYQADEESFKSTTIENRNELSKMWCDVNLQQSYYFS